MSDASASSSTPTQPEVESSPAKKRKSTSAASGSSAKKKTKQVNLAKKLHSLEKEQIIVLITEQLPHRFPEKYGEIEADVLTVCPDQNINNVVNELNILHRNIQKAFPRAKYGSNRDDYAFKRVKPCLTAFKKGVSEKIKEVKDGQNWHLMCDFLNKLLKLVEDLPDFDTAKNNKTKTALFKQCATNYEAMLKARDCDLSGDELDSISAAITDSGQNTNSDFADVIERLKKKKEALEK
ncbi:hypothetical protein C9374_007512 [Naegleria lovaniensis]|uniref:Uncharacterized protein n=1 Tax=Naegleria lovaniensis TaxID=51637 RepID=A0AA88GN66_NAELO|nr:uncharacterized protein C9374_007512 [Naegleria lovaniensis]KAG2379373.1 hypothetical protein C9374_007512 [Naegleria lovaniensis]